MGMVNLLFSFHGRINRAQYWLGAVLVTVLGLLLMGVLFALSGASLDPGQSKEKFAGAVLTLVMIVFIVATLMAYCQLAVQVKRFHDRGRTGYLSLVPIVMSAYIGFSIVSAALSGATPAEIVGASTTLSFILWLIQLAMFIDLGCLPGVEGPNKYGNPPGSPPSPVSPVSPSAPAKQNAATAAASMFGSAEKAIERAVEQQRAAASAARPAVAAAAGARPSFGRRAPS